MLKILFGLYIFKIKVIKALTLNKYLYLNEFNCIISKDKLSGIQTKPLQTTQRLKARMRLEKVMTLSVREVH